jgi:hypothetical protein
VKRTARGRSTTRGEDDELDRKSCDGCGGRGRGRRRRARAAWGREALDAEVHGELETAEVWPDSRRSGPATRTCEGE